MDIQTEVQKIHHKFGVSEKSNYEIQKLFDKIIKEEVNDVIRLSEQLKSFQNWQLENGYLNYKTIKNGMVDDYLKSL